MQTLPWYLGLAPTPYSDATENGSPMGIVHRLQYHHSAFFWPRPDGLLFSLELPLPLPSLLSVLICRLITPPANISTSANTAPIAFPGMAIMAKKICIGNNIAAAIQSTTIYTPLPLLCLLDWLERSAAAARVIASLILLSRSCSRDSVCSERSVARFS